MKIIFLCTANSCRSQMAEAWARHLLLRHWEIRSAGLLTYPISEQTRQVMAEVDLDLAGQHSKTLDGFDLDGFDLVVTLSENAGRFLPSLAEPDRHCHQPLADPMAATGSEAEVLQAFRAGRDEIRALVERIGAGEIGRPAASPDS